MARRWSRKVQRRLGKTAAGMDKAVLQIDNDRGELPAQRRCPDQHLGLRRKSRPRIAHRRIAACATEIGTVSGGTLASWDGGAPIELTLSLALKGHDVLVESHTEDGCVNGVEINTR